MRPRRRALWRAAAVLAAVALTGCGARGASRSSTPPALAPAVGTIEEGVASWYGDPYHGRPTSSGEIYNQDAFTAAHRTLPLGTRVRVENLSNGRSVVLTINDRGPFAKDRVIDVSRAAARQLQMIGPGTVRVRVRVVAMPGSVLDGFFAVQVGSFRERDNAERLQADLERRYGRAVIRNYDSPRGRFYRVLVGREPDTARAETLAQKLQAEGFDSFVVRVEERPAG